MTIAGTTDRTTTMMEGTRYDDDPELVRARLRRTVPGEWYVFEAFSADGSLTIGVATGTPDPSLVLVIYDGLSKPVARAAATGLAGWYRRQGRTIAGI